MRPGNAGLRTHGAAHHKEIHLQDLLGVVRRHWRVVTLSALLVAGGTYFSGRNAVQRFQSHLTVQITSQKQVFPRLDDIDVDELALKTDPILSEALLLTTQRLALRVVDAIDLQLEISDPSVYRGEVFAGIEIDSTATVGSYRLARRIGEGYELLGVAGERLASGTFDQPLRGPDFTARVLPPADEEHAVNFRIARREKAASWVSAGLGYAVRQSTSAVDISFTGTDPTLVPLILNQAAFQLRLDGAMRARELASRRREYIATQLARSDESFQEKLGELQQFKEAQRITDLSSEEQAIVIAIQEAEQVRQGLLVQISTLRQTMGTQDSIGIETLNRLAAIEGVAANAALSYQIQTLLELYDERRSLTAGVLGLMERNPQVDAIDQRIRQGHTALRAGVEAAVESLGRRDAGIEQNIASLRDRLIEFPGKETRIAQLQIESTIHNETYRYLLGQYEAARLQEATIVPYVTLLDGASPAGEIGTTLRQKIVLGFLVGLLLGLAGAFFLEYLDQTIKNSADIERAVGVPVLGLIPYEPRFAKAANGDAQPIALMTELPPDDPAAEAYRALRTNVTFVGADKPLQFIVVTSPGPGEGKSTTATNLALTLAQSR